MKLVNQHSLEHFIFGLRIYSNILSYQVPGGDLLQLLNTIDGMLKGNDRVLHIECLKLLKAVASNEKLSGVREIHHRS
jgi:hypothetical protein